MKYEDFVCCLEAKVKERIGEGVRTELHRVTKNNAIVLDGLSIYENNCSIAPTIYLNHYYEEYRDGSTIPELLDQICEVYQSSKVAEEFDPEMYLNYENVKKHLACKLINGKRNEKLLEDVPHTRFLDLALVVYCRVDDSVIGSGTILVNNAHCKSWGVTEQEVLGTARENMKTLLPVSFMNIRELIPADDLLAEEFPMYVLTNSESYFGAASMIYDSVLSEIGKTLEQDYWILPSSIHECIIIPVREDMQTGQLSELVREVNATRVAPEDFLSDSVYCYNTVLHRLTVAG